MGSLELVLYPSSHHSKISYNQVREK